MRRRGISLILVLGLTTAAVLVAFATANLAIFNLHFSTGVDRRENARNLAESVINMAIGKLVDTETYGTLGTEELTFVGQNYPGTSSGFLTFDHASAGARKIHWSTNNNNFGPIAGNGRPFVPGYTVHLVGQGVCGDVKVEVECLYHKPPFPKGLAVTGKARLNAVTLLGLAPGAPFTGDWSTVPENQRIPANVFACSTASDALYLNSQCVISGGAGACGDIVLDPGARVGGEVRAHAGIQDVPKFNPQDMLNRLSTTLGLLPFVPGPILADFALVTGDLNLDQDLLLEGGVLGVTGNLKMLNNHKISGRGAVIVGGSAELTGSDLEAGRQCALVAGGQVTLVSSNPSTFFFQGIVYSGTKIVASGVTVIGAVVCNGPPGQGDAELDNARVIESPVQVQGRRGLPFSENVGTTQPPVSPGGEPDGADSMLFSCYSLPDPFQPGKFKILGQAHYSMSPKDASGLLTGPLSGVDVYWRIGVSTWSLKPGSTDFDVRIPLGPKPYDGTPNSILQDIQLLSMTDKTNPPYPAFSPTVYYNEISSHVETYIKSLQGDGRGGEYLDFNLNRLVAPGEDSRILLMREMQAP